MKTKNFIILPLLIIAINAFSQSSISLILMDIGVGGSN